MKKRCLLYLLMAALLCMGMVTPAAAAEDTAKDYDGYSFIQWADFNGNTRSSSFSKVESSIFMNMGGTGDNGMLLTFEAAGNDQYYIWSNFRYQKTYLAVFGKNSAGEYYLGGTTSKSNALKWTFGTDGRLYTTYKSVEYCLWMYNNAYNGVDGFRLITDTKNYHSVCCWQIPMFPPETPHEHPSCGAVCTHEVPHETIQAFKLGVKGSYYTYSLESGDYYLDADTSLGRNVYISGDVRICLNGHKLQTVNGYGFVVERNSRLEICDCQGAGSISSSPKYEDSYYVYEYLTLEIMESASVILHDIRCCPEEGTEIDNEGTLIAYGSSFAEGIHNRSIGHLELYDCTFTMGSSYSAFLYNEGTAILDGTTITAQVRRAVGNYGTMSIGGGSVIRADGDAAIINQGDLKISDAVVAGETAILNGVSKYVFDRGICEISGGTFCGGIRNDGIVAADTYGDVEAGQIVKASLKITGTPSIDKIILCCADAFEFDYEGGDPIDLEIQVGETFPADGVVLTYDHEKVSALSLLNPGYILTTDQDNRVVLQRDFCSENGHDWEDATCIDPRICTVCGVTEGEALGHDLVFSGFVWSTDACEMREICTRCEDEHRVPVDFRLQDGVLSLGHVPPELQLIVVGYSGGQMVDLQWITEPQSENAITVCGGDLQMFFVNTALEPYRSSMMLN